MILDSQLQFSATAGDSPTATAVSTNQIDLGIVIPSGTASGSGIPGTAAGGGARDIGIGDDPALKIVALVTVNFATLTSLQIQVQGAPDNGSGSPGTLTTYASGPVVPVASLLAGTLICNIDMPRVAPGVAMPRFLGLNYVVAGSNASAGTLRAFLVVDRVDQIIATGGAMSGYVPGITIAN